MRLRPRRRDGTPMEVFLLLLDELDDAVATLRLRAARWLPFVAGHAR